MKIKDVEKQVGISKANIRFYEEEGLIHPARNQENNYREYSETDVEQLQEINKLRLIGVRPIRYRRSKISMKTD